MTPTEKRLAAANKTDVLRYSECVNRLVRERYSLSEELSLLRRRDEVPDAFAEYTAFAEDCKRRAREEVGA